MGDTAYGFFGWVSKGSNHWERDIKLLILDTTGNYSGPALNKNEFIEFSSLAAYPNPVEEVLHIPFSKPVKTLLLFHVDGRQLDVEFTQNNSEVQVNFSNLPNGNYIIMLQDSDGSFYRQQVVRE